MDWELQLRPHNLGFRRCAAAAAAAAEDPEAFGGVASGPPRLGVLWRLTELEGRISKASTETDLLRAGLGKPLRHPPDGSAASALDGGSGGGIAGPGPAGIEGQSEAAVAGGTGEDTEDLADSPPVAASAGRATPRGADGSGGLATALQLGLRGGDRGQASGALSARLAYPSRARRSAAYGGIVDPTSAEGASSPSLEARRLSSGGPMARRRSQRAAWRDPAEVRARLLPPAAPRPGHERKPFAWPPLEHLPGFAAEAAAPPRERPSSPPELSLPAHLTSSTGSGLRHMLRLGHHSAARLKEEAYHLDVPVDVRHLLHAR